MKILAALPSPEQMKDAIVAWSFFPQGHEAIIDDARIHDYAKDAFEFKFVKTAIAPVRGRLPEGQETSILSPLELLDAYWKSKDESETERALLSELAQDLISEVHSGDA